MVEARDSPDYEPYLAQKIEEEEIRLKSLQDRSRIASMEEQLVRLHIKGPETTEINKNQPPMYTD